MKGIFNLRPALQKYHTTWDPDIVLKYLEKWHPSDKINIKQLTLKVSALLILLSNRRGHTLVNLYLENTRISLTEIRISISELSKTSNTHRHEPEIIIKKFSNPTLCLITYLNTYIQKYNDT